jgi:hypothetical protein
MQIVPAVVTPVTAEQARVHLVAAMPGIDRDTGTLLLALIWIETAGGHLQNFNAGNITANDRWPGGAWRPPWFLVDASTPQHLRDLHESMLHGKAPSAFRAYSSMLAGFQDFAHVLRAQFPSVLEAAASGDAAAFVKALHDSGYSHDYTPAHVPNMIHLQQQLAPQFAGFPPGASASKFAFGLVAGVASEVVVAIIAAVALDHWDKGRRRRRAASH